MGGISNTSSGSESVCTISSIPHASLASLRNVEICTQRPFVQITQRLVLRALELVLCSPSVQGPSVYASNSEFEKHDSSTARTALSRTFRACCNSNRVMSRCYCYSRDSTSSTLLETEWETNNQIKMAGGLQATRRDVSRNVSYGVTRCTKLLGDNDARCLERTVRA